MLEGLWRNLTARLKSPTEQSWSCQRSARLQESLGLSVLGKLEKGLTSDSAAYLPAEHGLDFQLQRDDE